MGRSVKIVSLSMTTYVMRSVDQLVVNYVQFHAIQNVTMVSGRFGLVVIRAVVNRIKSTINLDGDVENVRSFVKVAEGPVQKRFNLHRAISRIVTRWIWSIVEFVDRLMVLDVERVLRD